MIKLKRYSVNGTEFGVRESSSGDYVAYEDYAALEARVKELEEDNTALRQQRAGLAREANAFEAELVGLKAKVAAGKSIKALWQDRAWTAEEELVRLKAQEPTLVLRPFGEVTQGAFVKCEHNHSEAINLYAEPRPAVLPDKLLPYPSNDKEELAYARGYNRARTIADALVLGCQPHQFIVKMLGDAVVFEHVQNGLAEYGKLPNGQKVTSQFAAGWNLRGEMEKINIVSAGGEIAE